ncbi:MAG: hypothetical protein KBA71_13185 [Opitutaceae bacterium]|nr:hypothetical protein [Opitutaceae bacterium]
MAPASSIPSVEKSLDRKLAALRANPDANVFILADAKDADLAWGCASPGDPWPPERRSFRSLQEFQDQMREIVRRGLVDILLASPATHSRLAKDEEVFRGTAVTPAVRANDTTDVWRNRGASYRDAASLPFAACTVEELQDLNVDLGLYSMTFNNSVESDRETLECFHRFRREAKRRNFRYFAEFFPPNIVDCGIPLDRIAAFCNDGIARTLAGVPHQNSPEFLKVPYWGPRALEELRNFDSTLIVGILGGGAGTTHDAFKLLADAKRHGARCALFGRKIKDAEDPFAFLAILRSVADDDLPARDAVRIYHERLKEANVTPRRSLDQDLEITFDDLTFTRL